MSKIKRYMEDKEDEFNLSDKVTFGSNLCEDCTGSPIKEADCLLLDDVKEIVKDLIDNLNKENKYSNISRKILRPTLERNFHYWLNKIHQEATAQVIKDVQDKIKEEMIYSEDYMRDIILLDDSFNEWLKKYGKDN